LTFILISFSYIVNGHAGEVPTGATRIAVAEELAAFLRTEALDDKGRFNIARGYY
jgi:hypothetical protein